jgi:hypothetical protein
VSIFFCFSGQIFYFFSGKKDVSLGISAYVPGFGDRADENLCDIIGPTAE